MGLFKFVKCSLILIREGQISVRIIHLLLKPFAETFIDRQMEVSDKMVQNRLIVLLQNVLNHITLTKVLFRFRRILAA